MMVFLYTGDCPESGGGVQKSLTRKLPNNSRGVLKAWSWHDGAMSHIMAFVQNLISDICDNLLLSKMSHQTGIGASDSLRQFFGKCRDGQYRVVKVYYFALYIFIFIYRGREPPDASALEWKSAVNVINYKLRTFMTLKMQIIKHYGQTTFRKSQGREVFV